MRRLTGRELDTIITALEIARGAFTAGASAKHETARVLRLLAEFRREQARRGNKPEI